MSKIIDRAGKGTEISPAENDSNLESLHGVNYLVSGTTHTVDINNQGDTIECTSSSATTITLDAIATIIAAAHTADFKVTIFASGSGGVTINRSSTDTFNGSGTSKALLQNEWITLQTDSTLAIWNIINSGPNLNGLTATVAELNILDGVTATASQINSVGAFASGTLAFSSVATATASGETDVAHGLGTDAIDFGFKVLGSNSTLALAQATSVKCCDANGYCVVITGNDVAGGNIPTPSAVPSAGNLRFKAYNGGTTQNITIHWWARTR